MPSREYDGPAIDDTMEHIAERDFDKEAENVEVPQESSQSGSISTEYGFLDSDELTKREKVERLWQRSEYDYSEYGSVTQFYEETVSPVLDVSKAYVSDIVGELEGAEAEDDLADNTENAEEEHENCTEDRGNSVSECYTEAIYTREEIEHNLLKPIVFAKKFAEGKEAEALEEAEELVNILIDRYGDEDV